MERTRPFLIVCALAAFAAAAPIGALLELSEWSFTGAKAGQMAHRELGVAEAVAQEPEFSLTFLSRSPLRREFVQALRSDFAFTRANGAAGPEEVAETKAKLRRALERALEAPLNDTVKTAMESEIETHDGPAV